MLTGPIGHRSSVATSEVLSPMVQPNGRSKRSFYRPWRAAVPLAVWSPSASPRPSWPRRAANSSSTSNVGSRPALSSRHRAIAPLGRLRLVKASVRQCLNNEVLWLCAMVKSVRLCLKDTYRLPSDRPPAARISGIRSAGTMQSRHLAPLSRPSPHRNRPVA